ncbi:hypothetical protein SAMN04488057_12813 [Cyclobacterium lianum]|uniref:NVEALA protein n=1 Tax=Cyclobacterium lianum TaxID=388280 RepID=A0A1M7QVR3_9BACT|nr:hypothetical protein [Cyclobacterium lianum]SHN35669.1 hypothetical protein SAMN04488057_12813 [Cyclobacterium lianum]
MNTTLKKPLIILTFFMFIIAVSLIGFSRGSANLIKKDAAMENAIAGTIAIGCINTFDWRDVCYTSQFTVIGCRNQFAAGCGIE